MKLYPLFVAVPLGVAFLSALIPKKLGRLADVLGNLGSVALVALVVFFFGRTGTVDVGGWRPPIGIVMVLDPLSWLLLATVIGVTFAVTIYSIRYMDRYTARGKYYALFFLMVAGMTGVIVTGDLFNLFVFLEIASISSYALVAFGCEADELEASFKYAVLGSIASTFVLFGIGLVYATLGTVNMGHVARGVEGLGGFQNSRVLTFALVFFVAGFGLKSALVPFHAWLPDAHPSAPAPISAMLSGVLIKAIGIYALARVFFNVFAAAPAASSLLVVLGAVSMVVGAILAMRQNDVKRMMAYSSISQMGYIAAAFGLGTEWGFVAGLFHLVSHAAAKGLLFLTAGSIEHETGTRDMTRMGALCGRMPVTWGSSFAGSMSISGVPPFGGFFSKLLIIFACVLARQWLVAAVAAGTAVVTLGYYVGFQRKVFFGAPGEVTERAREAPVLMCVSMVLLALLCLATAALIVPAARDAVLLPAARALLRGADYAKDVGLAFGGAR